MIYLAEEFANYINNFSFNSLPGNVVQKAKDIVIDWFAVYSIGKETKPYKIINTIINFDEKRNNQNFSTKVDLIEKQGNLLNIAKSAMAAGTAAHALDLDDTVLRAMLHPSASVVSAAITLGGSLGISGKKLLESVVVGYDVMVRLGEVINAPPLMAHHRRGFHPTGTCGVFGATVTAAKLLGLNVLEISNALGIAGSFASGILEFLHTGGMIKRLHPGKAAHDGILAALLSYKGFTGPKSVFEGKDGFFQAYSDVVNKEKALADLGFRYSVLDSSLKLYACCHHIHSSISGLQEIMDKNGINYDQINTISVGLASMAAYQVAEPIELKWYPRTLLEAQMSLPFCLATSAVYRKVMPKFILEGLCNPSVKELCCRITAFRDESLDSLLGQGFMPARLVVTTKRGETFRQKYDFPPGVPQRPLTHKQIKEKFMELTSSNRQQAHIWNLLENLENVDDISVLR